MPPRLARLLAAVAAILLVAGAFVARGVVSDDGDGEVRSGVQGGGDGDGDGGDALRVVCDEDLGSVCEAFAALEVVQEVTVLSAEEAGQALIDAPAEHDAWVTLDPVPAVTAARIGFDPEATQAEADAGVAVASSPLAVLVDGETDLGCAPPVTWDCLASEPRRPPVGVPDPRTALGAVTLGHAAAGLLGTSDFGIRRVQDDAEVGAALRVLLDAAEATSSDQARAILQPAGFRAVVTTMALADVTAGTSQGEARELTILPLAGAPTVGVVVAPWGGGDPSSAARLADAVLGGGSDQTVRDALADAGWEGGPARSTGLPDPDVIYALQEELAR